MRLKEDISLFHYAGSYDYGGLDYFVSGSVKLVKKGNYAVKITGKANCDRFSKTGAMITLARLNHRTEDTVAAGIASMMSLLLIVVSQIGLVMASFLRGKGDVGRRGSSGVGP